MSSFIHMSIHLCWSRLCADLRGVALPGIVLLNQNAYFNLILSDLAIETFCAILSICFKCIYIISYVDVHVRFLFCAQSTIKLIVWAKENVTICRVYGELITFYCRRRTYIVQWRFKLNNPEGFCTQNSGKVQLCSNTWHTLIALSGL